MVEVTLMYGRSNVDMTEQIPACPIAETML